MSAEFMPETSRMEFFEDWVNSPESACPAPKYINEPFFFTLPQARNPVYMTKKDRKKEDRRFVVVAVFVAWQYEQEGCYPHRAILRWRYTDLKVRELV